MANLQTGFRYNWPFSSGIPGSYVWAQRKLFLMVFFFVVPVGVPQYGSLILENPIKRIIWGYLHFRKLPDGKVNYIKVVTKMQKTCWQKTTLKTLFGMGLIAADHWPVSACTWDEHQGSILQGPSHICWDFPQFILGGAVNLGLSNPFIFSGFFPSLEFQGKPTKEDQLIVLGNYLGYQQSKQPSMKQSTYCGRKTSCTSW